MKKNWEYLNPYTDFIYFNHFEEFFDSLNSNSTDLHKIDIILTDYYFDKIKIGITLFSNDYLGTLRNSYGYKEFIVLCSNISLNNHEKIDKIIDKIPVELDILLKTLITKLS